MMRLLSRWHNERRYESLLWLESKSEPGVRFSIRKVSLGQRIDLAARIRELSFRNEFLRAGESADQLEAALSDLLVQKLYVEWGLYSIEGLRIDGEKAATSMLIERGPEALVNEIASEVQAQLELSDDERKN